MFGTIAAVTRTYATPGNGTVGDTGNVNTGNNQVFVTSGSFSAIFDVLRTASYTRTGMIINTETGTLYQSFQLIPFSAVPFNAPSGAVVVVYESERDIPSEHAVFYGYKVSNGWWIGTDWYFNSIVQQTVDFLLYVANGGA